MVRQMTGSVPALVAASVLGASGCGESSSIPVGPARGGAGGSAGSSVITVGGTTVAAGASGGAARLPDGCQGYEVKLPDVGQPAVAGEICAVEVEPVISNGAARVSLDLPEGRNPKVPVVATLTLAAELRAQMLGPPVVELIDASNLSLLDAELSPLEETADGYTFVVTWPANAFLPPQDMTRVSFRTALDLSCDTGTRLVNAVTDVHLCGGSELSPTVWASTGDTCIVCNVIAELAASPIIPDHRASGLPLGQAMRARIVELAKVGGSVVLFAENDGGQATAYEWHATGGSLEHIAEDVVIFRADGSTPAPSLQVAIVSDEGVAVVSYAYPGGAH